MSTKPFIASSKTLPEITVKVIVLSVLLSLVLAASNAYLALKVGILTSASIPAAVLSMAILRWFNRANILENNLIQTAASSGEAVAGGIVYTIPALILIHAWQDFSYWENVFIALTGGILGILISVPLRRILVEDKTLKFPEGKAIATILIAGTEPSFKIKPIILGSLFGALMELAQSGLKIFSSVVQGWRYIGNTLWGFGLGLSATMLGVGYLVGIELGVSLLIGALITWGAMIPLFSHFTTAPHLLPASKSAMMLWANKIHYVGMGALLMAGLWTITALIKPFAVSLKEACAAFNQKMVQQTPSQIRTEKDIPLTYVILGLLLCLLAIGMLFNQLFFHNLILASHWLKISLLSLTIVYTAIFSFLAVAICSYFSGMVGVTASPGSAVIVSSLIIITILLKFIPISPLIHHGNYQLQAAAVAIIVTSIITGAAAIANDNIQDLKVGQLVGATPWKQQVMLILGVVVAALIIPVIMRLLFHVYGIGNVLPQANMDIANSLPAPPAAMMAAITGSVFNNHMPWSMILVGMAIVLILIPIQKIIAKKGFKLSTLGLAMGMYLPLTISTPIFMGSLVQAWVNNRSKISGKSNQAGHLIACGLVTGAALMDVLLAIPFLLLKNTDGLAILPANYHELTTILGIVAFIGLIKWLSSQATK